MPSSDRGSEGRSWYDEGLRPPDAGFLNSVFRQAQPRRYAAGLTRALAPILEQIAQMTLRIKRYDRQILELTQTEYPETNALLKVQGVGHITALRFVLTLGNRQRFKRSREVGCYLGLRPRRSQSGDRDPQLGITKAGIVYLRGLLIECANHIFRSRGKGLLSSSMGSPSG